MGYTHYYTIEARTPLKQLAAAVADCKKIINANKTILAGWDGTGKPLADGAGVSINGIGENSHETFTFPENNGFCKTARKPYDPIVVACLAAIKDRLGKYFSVDSDGDLNDWKAGVQLASETLKREIKNPIKEVAA